MGRLFDHDTYLQNDEVSEGGINPYVKNRCIGCKYCEARRIGKFTNVFYCTSKNKFVSPNSVKECFKFK